MYIEFKYDLHHDLQLKTPKGTFSGNHTAEHLFLGVFMGYLSQISSSKYLELKQTFPKIANESTKPNIEQKITLDFLLESFPFKREKKRGLKISNQYGLSIYFYLGEDSNLCMDDEEKVANISDSDCVKAIQDMLKIMVDRNGFNSLRSQEVNWYSKYIMNKLSSD